MTSVLLERRGEQDSPVQLDRLASRAVSETLVQLVTTVKSEVEEAPDRKVLVV